MKMLKRFWDCMQRMHCVHSIMHTNESLNPESFGFEMDDSSLLPEKKLLEIDDCWTVVCKQVR